MKNLPLTAFFVSFFHIISSVLVLIPSVLIFIFGTITLGFVGDSDPSGAGKGIGQLFFIMGIIIIYVLMAIVSGIVIYFRNSVTYYISLITTLFGSALFFFLSVFTFTRFLSSNIDLQSSDGLKVFFIFFVIPLLICLFYLFVTGLHFTKGLRSYTNKVLVSN